MTVKVTRIQKEGFLWVDIAEPNRKTLTEIALELRLPLQTLKDCLRPEHLPKFERFGDTMFIVTRMYDEKCDIASDNVQELTRKIALFWGPGFMVTVHRKELAILTRMRERVLQEEKFDRNVLFSEILLGIVHSYASPIDIALVELEDMELRIFKGEESSALIENAYYLKRRASIFRRILKLTADVALRFQNVVAGETNDVLQDVQEEVQHHLFHLEELHENTNNVLNLHLSLSTQKTNQASHAVNEVMRVLTIFSVFLMPLNLIASIYGMNFRFMPELEFKYGYPMVLTFMFVISLVTYLAFKRRGWIR